MTYSMVKIVAGMGVLAAVSLSGAKMASAELDGPLINTTCSYPQVMAAMQVEAPNASTRLAERPDAQAKLQQLLALPVDQRKQRVQQFLERNPDVRAKIDEKLSSPEGQAKVQTAADIAATCHNY
jgi:hemophore-related protein